MKVLLLGNYPYLRSQSMDRFAGLLYDGLRATGHQVRLLKPQPVFGRMLPSATGLGKWLGYLDRFLLFFPLLKQAADWADVVHICDQANAVYAPCLNRKPHVVTCHDMISIRSALGEFTENTTGPTGKVYQHWILSGLKQARHVACVSNATYNDVLRLTGLNTGKVSLVRNGLNFPYRRMGKLESLYYLEQIGLGNCQPFFLHVGGNQWYKNKKGLLRIFRQLLNLERIQRPKLVLAGESLDHQLRLVAKELGISDRLLETPNVTNEQLCALYSSAEGFIFPSFAEGFGWPIVEAQACGCPVFTSNIAPMTEIGGHAAVYIDSLDAGSAAKIIWKEIQNREAIKECGYNNAKKYSIRAMITGYVDCYDLVVSQK